MGHVLFAVEIKYHKGDAQQRLENSFQDAQAERGNIETMRLLSFSELLQKRLRILRGH